MHIVHTLKVIDVLLFSKDLMVKVVQNIPTMLVYLPSQINVRTQASFSVLRGAPFAFNWSSNRHRLCKTQSVHHCPNPLSNYKCTAFVWLSF